MAEKKQTKTTAKKTTAKKTTAAKKSSAASTKKAASSKKKGAAEVAGTDKEAVFTKKLQDILELAKQKKNVLEINEIKDFFKELNLNDKQFDKILDFLENNGIEVLRTDDSADIDDMP